LIFFFLGLLFQRFGVFSNVIVPYFSKKNIELNNFIANDLEVLSLNIPFDNYKKLIEKRNHALETGILVNDGKYFSASIGNDGNEIDVKIRLKGDLRDHFAKEEKLSYRVIVKNGKTILGMNKFSIQHPKSRFYLGEWLFHKVVSDEDIISLRYDFIKVILNGKDLGIYAIEEHFSDLMLENNHRRPGPILKFSERFYWDQRKNFGIIPGTFSSGIGGFHSSQIEAFNKKNIESDSILLSQYNIALKLLSDFRKGIKTVEEVFDVNRLSTFFALTDVFQAHHGNRWNNVRLYFNPITNLFEPISFDSQIGYHATFLACNPDELYTTSYGPYFKDYEFYESYLTKLKKYGRFSFYQSIQEKYKIDMDRLIKLLKKEWPDYQFDYNLVNNNINFIRSILNPGKFVDTKLFIDNKKINMSIGNLQILPLTNFHLQYADSSKFDTKINIILEGKKNNQILDYINFDIKELSNKTEINHEELKLGFQIIGIDSIIYENIQLINSKTKLEPKNSINKTPNYLNFNFITEIPGTNEIIFNTGLHLIKEDIILPKNKIIIIKKGTKLNFLNNHYIYTQSPVQMIGEVDMPIFLYSSDSTGGGLLIDRAQGLSYLKNVYIENFGEKQQSQRSLTGAFTVYESNIELESCDFSNNKSEDALNIIRSNLKINNCTFNNNSNDAIDLDFSNGIINNSYFFKSGNDAIDCSGSEIYITGIYIDNAMDKGISAGEITTINGNNIKIINTNIGLVSKDHSNVILDELIISDSNVALAIFQKKEEFGPAKMKISNGLIKKSEIEFLLEEKSNLVFNEHLKYFNSKNLRNQIYSD
tara:strand:+ start:4657 stop:7110 length:2454 start_codon:yes stop_codon:yes gene_type:complete